MKRIPAVAVILLLLGPWAIGTWSIGIVAMLALGAADGAAAIAGMGAWLVFGVALWALWRALPTEAS